MAVFAHIKSFFSSHQNSLSKSVLFALFVFMFFGGAFTTFADSVTSIQESFIDLIVLVVHAVVYLTWVIIGIMGSLLSNDTVMHPGVISTLKLLWTIIRNFINMAAVFWLLYIAFKTLFNFGDDGSEAAKTGLPKLAAALVLVNFSWLFMVVIIDASTVATNYAFSLTDTVRSSGIHFAGDCKTGETKNCVQKVYSIQWNQPPKMKPFGAEEKDPKEKPKSELTTMVFKIPYESKPGFLQPIDFSAKNIRMYELNDVDLKGSNGYKCFDGTEVNGEKGLKKGCTPEEYLKYKYETAVIRIVTYPLDDMEVLGAHSITPTIATNLLQLESNLQRSKYTNSMGGLALDVIFSVIMSLIMLIAFVALFVILVIRVAIMWIGLMASPLLVLWFFEPMEEAVKSSFEKFVHMAFVPAYFGVVFSLVFVLIGQLGYQKTGLTGTGDATKPIILDNGILETGHPLFNVLLTILIIVLFWMAVFWALEKADFTGAIISTMKEKVQGGAAWLAKRPLYLDIVPIASRSGAVQGKTDLATMFGKGQGALEKWGGTGTAEDKLGKRIAEGEFDIKDSKLSSHVEKIMNSGASGYKTGYTGSRALESGELDQLVKQAKNGNLHTKDSIQLQKKILAATLGDEADRFKSGDKQSLLQGIINAHADKKGIDVSKGYSSQLSMREALNKSTGALTLNERITNNANIKFSNKSSLQDADATKLIKALGKHDRTKGITSDDKKVAFIKNAIKQNVSYEQLLKILEDNDSNGIDWDKALS